MPTVDLFKNTIFNITSSHMFEQTALAIFLAQAEENLVYKNYLNTIGIVPNQVKRVEEIPHLPISFFKTHQVATGTFDPEITFTSSGTTGSKTSSHHVKSIEIYEHSFRNGFELFYSKPDNYCILALLPAYLERTGSSLVYMADKLIADSKHPQSGFYLNDYAKLIEILRTLAMRRTPTLLLGVSFALLDVAELLQKFHHPKLTVMETGGMKGRRKEMIREELHAALKRGFGVSTIHSEYGMTELLSQAYSSGNGKFESPPWMKMSIRSTTDPFEILPDTKTGGLNVIDLANMHSCAFIATEDLGRTHADGSFEVLGRFDQADIRGCNLLAL